MCGDQALGPPLLREAFFPEMSDHVLLTEAERGTVRAVAGVLDRASPSQVHPARTAVLRTPDGALRLELRHDGGATRLTLVIDDGTVALRWTGGEIRGPWGSELESVLEAMLLGRNELVMQLRLGSVLSVDTLIWDDGDDVPRLVCRRATAGWTPRLLRRLPGTCHVERMSLSFERAEPLGPAHAPESRDRSGARRDVC